MGSSLQLADEAGKNETLLWSFPGGPRDTMVNVCRPATIYSHFYSRPDKTSHLSSFFFLYFSFCRLRMSREKITVVALAMLVLNGKPAFASRSFVFKDTAESSQ